MRTTKLNVITIELGEEVEIRNSTGQSIRVRVWEAEGQPGLEVTSDDVIWIKNIADFEGARPELSEVGITFHAV